MLILAVTITPAVSKLLSGNYFQVPSLRFLICKMGIILDYLAKLDYR